MICTIVIIELTLDNLDSKPNLLPIDLFEYLFIVLYYNLKNLL